MEINKSEFVKSAVMEKDYPKFNNVVEFSFIGRSNVGKSSLINSLTKRKNLARTSKTPGRTQLSIVFPQFFFTESGTFANPYPGKSTK